MVENSEFSNTYGTPPAAGIDIEPDGEFYDLINITIRHSVANNNYGHGMQLWNALSRPQHLANFFSIVVEHFDIRGGPGGWHANSPPGTEWSPKAGGFAFALRSGGLWGY